MLTHGNLVANAFAFMSCWPFTAQTRWLVVAPMFHAAGTIATLATVWAGGEHVILPGFDAEATLDTIEREKVTATLVVPTMMSALSQAQDRAPRDVSSLRYLSHGSSPVAADVLRQTHASFPDAELLHIYGLTETSPIVTLLRSGESVLDTDRARSCGQPAIGVELRIADPQHQSPAPSGHVGEVQVRGLNVTPGYWGKPDATAQAFVDGWYATGDLGYLDAEGFLFLVDRVKDMIITGGENVYSTEVEQALYAHPAVSEAAVFGVPDTRWGEAVHALVYCTDAATSAELIEHCKVRIASYKIPKQIELAEQPLPKSGAGKILKRKLKDLYWPSR
jgi:long-chain acyl-CoA synthetase